MGGGEAGEGGLGEHDVLVVAGEHEALAFDFDAGDVGASGGYF